LKPVRTEAVGENLCARGAYRLKAAENPRKAILIATGSEVEIALSAAEYLETQGIGTDVVSMPCTERFDAQPASHREDILPDDPAVLRVSIEAGTTFGWERYTGLRGLRIGIDRFGVSAPAKDAYEFFGFTPDAVAARVLQHLRQRESA
jgi:transketolase